MKFTCVVQKIMNRYRQYAVTAKNMLTKPVIVNSLPMHIQIEVTTYCNMNCLSCGRRHIVSHPKNMTYDDFVHIYDQIRPQNINLSGIGEPLLNPEIFRMIEYCKSNDAIVNFPTNLTMPPPVVEKLVHAKLDQLKISIDAVTRETYREVKGADKFDRVIQNIRLINSIKAEMGVHHPDLRFNFALQKYNVHELPRLVNLACEMGVSTIYVQDLNYFSVEDDKPKLCGIDKKTLRKVLNDSERLAKNCGIKTNIANWRRNFERFYNKMLPKDQYVPNNNKCNFPWFSIFIDVEGNVKPCPVFVFAQKGEILGNCMKESFASIWNNDRYQRIRNEFKDNIRRNDICKYCVPPNILDINLIFRKMLLRG